MERTASSLHPTTEHLTPFATLPRRGSLGSSKWLHHNRRFCERNHNTLMPASKGNSQSNALENTVPRGRTFSAGRRSIQQDWIHAQRCNRTRFSPDHSRLTTLLNRIGNRMVDLRGCLGTPSRRLFGRGRRCHGPALPSDL